MKWICLIAAVHCLNLLSGCGSSGSPFEYVKVSGKLSYEDGSPIPAEGIKLIFDSQAPPIGNAHPRQGSAMVNPAGEFKDITSYKYADGLVPGKHKVSILYATDAKGKLLVPPECTKANSTSLLVDTADSPFDIKVPKPKSVADFKP
jgi:hypothetical protein